MITQKLTIQPQGILESGTVQYSADQTGLIQWAVGVVAGILFFTQNYDYSGTVKIDPKYFDSALWSVGMKIAIGPFTMTVASIDQGVATCQVSVVDPQDQLSEAGTALVDLSQPNISVKSISLNGTIQGYDISIAAS